MCSVVTATGLLERLWGFTAQHAPTGDLSRFGLRQIAHMIGWAGEPGPIFEALVASGWLDRSEAGLLVHDWSEHADRHVHRTLVRQLEPFADGTTPTLAYAGQTERLRWEAHKGRPDGKAPGSAPGEPRGSPLGSPLASPPGSPPGSPPESIASKPEAGEPEESSKNPTLLPSNLPPPASPAASVRVLREAVEREWPSLRAFVESCGRTWVAEISKHRMELMVKVLRALPKEPPGVLLRIAEGAWSYWNAKAPDRDHVGKLDPDTLFRPSNWPKYLDAYKEPSGQGGKIDAAYRAADEWRARQRARGSDAARQREGDAGGRAVHGGELGAARRDGSKAHET